MPELVANGPSLPARLMNELDGGSVVFFCGAGISMDPESDLPDFGGLVKHVYHHHRLEPDVVEREALDWDERAAAGRRPSYDKAFELLERPARLGAQALRRSVIDRLSMPPAGRLVTHEALIDLSRTAQGVRLVTTNFDNRFVEAGLEERLVDLSPKLPVPKRHDWSSLVHLHGRIRPDGDRAPMPDGSDLVLTSADLGRAYLSERWAARFVTELFREFTVVFVGYSLGDPVMRYLVDALAAERARGARFESAYAFAPYGGDSGPSRERARDGWLAKNVKPISYDARDRHRLLSDTLIEWARIRNDPFLTRSRIVLDGISKLPDGAGDPLVERVTWALSDPAAAEALAEATPVSDESDFPKIEQWLDEFAEAGLLARSARDGGGSTPGQGDSAMRLVDDGARTRNPPDPDPVTDALARWMARHLHVPQVLGWVLRNGGCLHPRLRELVRRALVQPAPPVEIPPRLRHLWTIVANREPADSSMFRFASRQFERTASDSERRRLEEQTVESIAPRLIVRPGPSSELELKLRREWTR